MSILNTTDSSFDLDIQTDQAVLLDFWAPWCGPCKALNPSLQRLSDKLGDKLRILKINTDENPLTPTRFNVRGFPTLIFMVRGEERGRLAGTTTARLNVSVEKWMADHGFLAPAGEDAGIDTDTAVPAAGQLAWSGFAGKAALKEQGLARMAALPDDNMTSPTQQLLGDAKPEDNPTGIPAPVGALLDLMWRISGNYGFQPFGELRETLMKLLQSMPVGADLGGIVKQVQYDATHASAWSISQYPFDDAAKAVVAIIQANHAREIAGEVVPAQAWAEAAKRAILLPAEGDDDSLSRNLENLCVPLGTVDIAAALLAVMRLADSDERQAPHWGAADKRKLQAAETALEHAALDELGPYPADANETEGEQWRQAYATFTAKWDSERRLADAQFWTRYDAYLARMNSNRQDLFHYLSTQLSQRFAAVNR